MLVLCKERVGTILGANKCTLFTILLSSPFLDGSLFSQKSPAPVGGAISGSPANQRWFVVRALWRRVARHGH